jgi:hypothetical protein
MVQEAQRRRLTALPCWSAMQSLGPVGGDDSGWSRYGLVLGVVRWRCKLRALGVVVGGEVPEPVFAQLETLDVPVSTVSVVGTRVLAR